MHPSRQSQSTTSALRRIRSAGGTTVTEGRPITRVTADGFPRYHVTAVIEEPLFTELESYRTRRQLSRSDAIKRILAEHLSRQLNHSTASNI